MGRVSLHAEFWKGQPRLCAHRRPFVSYLISISRPGESWVQSCRVVQDYPELQTSSLNYTASIRPWTGFSGFAQSGNYTFTPPHIGKSALWQHRTAQNVAVRYTRCCKNVYLWKWGGESRVLCRKALTGTLPKHSELPKWCISPNHNLQPQSGYNSCPSPSECLRAFFYLYFKQSCSNMTRLLHFDTVYLKFKQLKVDFLCCICGHFQLPGQNQLSE